ncbi:MAG: hypothetical protein GY710_17400 [Desulfobacteraceae bacterium]|nr:hypothetical protein [Desulfobacteraceae bacterium]
MRNSKKGKILRVKQGYNPNSSSIGSIVFAIPTMLLISSAIFGTATTIIFSKYLKKTDKDNSRQDEIGTVSKE